MTYTGTAFMLLSILSSYNASGKLLVFLIDGLRYDYLNNLDNFPGFRQIVENGVKVDYMTPEFPSLSYPNYYSLMTGRNTEVHQMTGNYMWDMDSDTEFLLGTNADSRLPLWWDGAEPIWVTMEKLGKRVYMYYWPGCEGEILGVRPSLCEPYQPNANEGNLTDAMERALDALNDGQTDMAAVYYERVDAVGHFFGPQSVETTGIVLGLDGAMQFLNQRVMAKNMSKVLNIVMFSDHGMSEITNLIELDKHINLSDVIKVLDIGPVVSLWPKQEKFEEVRSSFWLYSHLQLMMTESAVENMTTYRISDIPDRFHYKEGRFVSTLTLVAKPGWIITPTISALPFQPNATGDRKYGAHGYDNELVEMRGFFVAKGPDFKSNFSAGPIRSVDAYNVMCHTLGIDPLPNSGSLDRVRAMLREPSSTAVLVTQHSCLLVLIGLFICVHVSPY
ncbi:glycerophosphocholine cholinephosphodiesterase ENPP6-like isoform X1 [Alosa sapidissima]|uniref:glycerophosphocholine cholinephosphodiesterase ENPP6-like isoform X1 n=1 Tax=Alosa sapidissima TaxID=34773 RepID=UPI001C0871CA|nr:glycerophosphocholine cholinephosphodiesterase ENPP6-like isoform X1 [Alosa sapidissima]